MSYDLSLTCKCKNECCQGELNSQNLTYNYSPMWREAFGDSIKDLNGLTGRAAAVKLASGLAVMESEPGRFIAHNPPNGWGSYDHLLPAIREMLNASDKYPDAVWDVS